ncbi:MAG: hypothetical protein MZU91_01965 [Desulfosudis oleivorans]|nr:hypothetical protein [Desulfosudis oleivorans]
MMELFMKTIMRIALLIVAGALGLILWTIITRGLPSLDLGHGLANPQGRILHGQGRRHPQRHHRLGISCQRAGHCLPCC